MSNTGMTPSKKCYDLIRKYEGFSAKPYKDVAGIPTIGYGTTYYPNGVKVTMKDPSVTTGHAETYLEHHVNEVASSVRRLVKVTLRQGQLDALTSLVYNIGIGNFSASTLLRVLNQGKYTAASDQFLVWSKAGGAVSRGLELRRESEKALFDS